MGGMIVETVLEETLRSDNNQILNQGFDASFISVNIAEVTDCQT